MGSGSGGGGVILLKMFTVTVAVWTCFLVWDNVVFLKHYANCCQLSSGVMLETKEEDTTQQFEPIDKVLVYVEGSYTANWVNFCKRDS